GTCQPNQPGNPPSAIDVTTRTDLLQATAFLYEGPNPQQIGVAPGTIKRARVSIFRGKVLDRDGQPIQGVVVRAVDHPEYGYTQTAADGVFSMAINGGQRLRLDYQREGYLPVQRSEEAPLLDYAWFPDVVMTQMDPARTIVDLAGTPAPQVAVATPTADASGPRQQLLLFGSGTQATVTDANGTSQPISTLSVHSTEYTVGPQGPQAMPAPLPPTSGYTYAAEFTVEEAMATPDSRVEFSRPVISYVDNFLHFPVGTPVPVGYYDRVGGMWIPAPNGRVIKVLETLAGLAELDTDGDDAADDAATLAALGIDDEERTILASQYLPGDALWRVPVTHFTTWDSNWPIAPPEDFKYPDDPKPEQKNKQKPGDCHTPIGSTVGCGAQTMNETIGVVGTPFSLSYSTDRSPAYAVGAASANLTLSGPTIPASLKRIEVTTSIAGRTIHQEFAPAANLKTTVAWDGLDGFGRAVAGRQPATVKLSYVYDAVYGRPRADVEKVFGHIPKNPIESDNARAELSGSASARVMLDHSNTALEEGLGGWTLDVHHTYDPRTLTLTRGDNGVQSGDAAGGRPPANVTLAFDYSLPGTDSINDFKATSDGTIYAALTSFFPENRRLMRIFPNGTQQVAAANVEPFAIAIDGDRVLFTDQPRFNASSIPFKPYWPAVLKALKPDGSVVTLAGSAADPCIVNDQGQHPAPPFFGNGGPAIDACLENVSKIAVAPDGSIYLLANAWPTGVPYQLGGSYWQIR
ncbi:MAG TPA: hypothetical protein VIF57_10120, partial [Polyangia bacterium]